MSTTKLANIFVLSTLAILLCSFAPSQTLALAVQPNHLARQVPNHHGIAKKKRGKRDGQCKPRTSTPPTSTPAYQPTSSPQSSPSPNSSPSPSSTQSSNPVATNTPSTGKKLGIAWALYDDPRLLLITAGGRAGIIFLWDYNISPLVRQTGLAISIMLWNDAGDKIAGFEQAVQAGGINDCRGANEVNEPSQANMSVEQGISLWRQHLAPHRSQCGTLSSPCTTSAPNGFDWTTQYYNECPDCRDSTDYQTIHWYDVKLADLQAYVEKWKAFGKPLRLTEFACQNFNGGNQPSMDDIWAFTTGAVEYLHNEPSMDSFAPFGYMDDLYNVNPNDGLFTSSGLSDLGAYYAYNA